MKLLLLFLMMLAAPSWVFAEPSPTVKYLMNEPVSMLDWGLYRLEKRLSEFKHLGVRNPIRNSQVSVYYDWDHNRINISLAIYPSYASFKTVSPKEACKSATNIVRGIFVPHTMNVGVAQYFNHDAFKSKSQPNNFVDEIENIVTIRVDVWADANNDKSRVPIFQDKCTCESPLLGTDVRIIEQ